MKLNNNKFLSTKKLELLSQRVRFLKMNISTIMLHYVNILYNEVFVNYRITH